MRDLTVVLLCLTGMKQTILHRLILIGSSLVTMEGNEVPLITSDVAPIRGIPVFLLRDIFLHLDVCTKFRLQR